MSKPKILHVITGLGRGGAEAMLAKIIGMSDAYLHSVLSLTSKGEIGPLIEAQGNEVSCLNLERPGHLLAAGYRLPVMVRQAKPDLIQGWLNHGNLAAMIGARLSGLNVPVAWNVRQSLLGMRFEKWQTRCVMRMNARLSARTAAILYNSHSGRRDHEAMGFAAHKGMIVPNGFDLNEFFPSHERRVAFRASVGISPDQILIGLVARFDQWKNHATFFEAACRVLDHEPGARFLFAGSGMLLDNAELRALIRDPRLLEASLFLGTRSDMPALTASLDIACNVSHGEGFPNAIGEAMASSVPCIVVPSGDMPAIVADTGIVAETATAEDIAAGIRILIARGPCGRAELGNAARDRVGTHFSLAAIVARYEAIYDMLLLPRKSGGHDC